MCAQPTLVEKTVLQCDKCGEVFGDDYDQCPKCGSRRFLGYLMVNPVARLPMESILRFLAHLFWIMGTVVCVGFLWNTNTQDSTHNIFMMFAGFGVLAFSLIFSVALFAMGEMLKRIIRIQRRVRAILDEYQTQGG